MKRIIVIILAFALTIPGISVFAAEESFNQKYYTESINLLNALGIVSGSEGSILTEREISRIELLKTVIDAQTNCGIDGYSTVSTSFTDVPETSMGYIEYALSLGIIMPGMQFKPDEAADFRFAEMIMVRAAGHKVQGQAYDRTASEIGLLEKVRPEARKSFKMGDALVMIYNYIANVRVSRLLDNAYAIHDISILSEIYKVQSVKAKLVADDSTAADGKLCERDHLRFEMLQGGEITLAYSGDVQEMMGRRVKVYYNEDLEAISMTLMHDTDILSDITAQTYKGYNPMTRKISWNEYRESNRWESAVTVKSLKIPQNADIMFNGRYTTQHSMIYRILESQNGYNIESIQLIASENNKNIDLVKITAYKAAIVNAADERLLVIKHDGNIGNIDYDEYDPDVDINVVNTAGETMKFSSIPAKSVISVFETLEEPKKVKIVVSTTKINAMLTSVDTDNNISRIIAEGTEYILSENSTTSVSDIRIGNEYVLSLDHCGRVVNLSLSFSDNLFLGGIVKVKKDSYNEALNITVFNLDGKTLTLKNAEKWYVNGCMVSIDGSNGRMIYTDSNGDRVDVIQKIENEFAQFTLNSNGEIKKIVTAKKGAEKGELGYTLGMNNPDGVFENPEANSLCYKNSGKYFFPDDTGINCMNFVAIDASTKVMKMPSKNIVANRESYFSVLKPEFSNDSAMSVVGYTMSGSGDIIADVIVIVTDSSSNPENGAVRVIKDISGAVNDDNELCYKLEVVDANGNESTILTESQSFPEYVNGALTGGSVALEVGDIIRYGVNANGHANAFIRVYDESTGTIEEKNPAYWYAASRVVKGCVYNTDESKFTYIVGNSIDGNVDGRLQVGTAETVIFFDRDEDRDNKLRVGTVQDLVGYTANRSQYSKVIIMTGYGDMRTIFSYK